MNNHLTEIVFILDRSGSMSGFEADTVGGFNATVEKQKKEAGHAYVSTVLFNNTSTVLHDRADVRDVRPLTAAEYEVGGCTALLDAVGDAIRHIRNIHKYARPEDVPAHTVFLITTDGMENASSRYDYKTVKRMIKEQTQKYGWEFIFLAANIDAAAAAESIGIRRERAARPMQTPEGINASFGAMSEAISAVRRGDDLTKTAWKRDLEENA